MSGAYIHIPFCRKACSYCDFHFSTSLKQKDALVLALTQEIELRKGEWPDRLNTLYFGGGTPSLLDANDIQRIVDAVQKLTALDRLQEMTLEANPEDITQEKLRAWKKAGFDRLSIGTQSFFERDLRFMNRDHSPEQAVDAVKRAQDVGFEKISIDLIYGIPAQSMLQWQENVGRALALNTGHLSSYCLTIEPKTALHKALETGAFAEKADEHIEAEFHYLHKALEASGLEHYEISNFAKAGQRAAHNGNYWNGKPYLGIGPSAHSFDGELRRKWNLSNNARYIKALNETHDFWEEEVLQASERCNEIVMTSLRTKEGCSRQVLEQHATEEWLLGWQKNLEQLTPEMRSWMTFADEGWQMKPAHWLKCDALLREIIV